jgi:hypothetical protein
MQFWTLLIMRTSYSTKISARHTSTKVSINTQWSQICCENLAGAKYSTEVSFKYESCKLKHATMQVAN